MLITSKAKLWLARLLAKADEQGFYNIWYRPKGGRYGAMPDVLATGGSAAAAAVLTASATNSFLLGNPFRKFFVYRMNAAAVTKPAGSSTFNTNFFKNNAATSKQLTTTLDLATLTNKVNKQLTLAANLTEANLLFQEGDVFQVDCVVGGTVTTQPVGLIFAADVGFIE